MDSSDGESDRSILNNQTLSKTPLCSAILEHGRVFLRFLRLLQ